jgi:hypothetical protein
MQNYWPTNFTITYTSKVRKKEETNASSQTKKKERRTQRRSEPY